MKEVWFFLYRDYELDGKIFSSIYYDAFEEAWTSRKYMQEGYNSAEPISPVMKGYIVED